MNKQRFDIERLMELYKIFINIKSVKKEVEYVPAECVTKLQRVNQ